MSLADVLKGAAKAVGDVSHLLDQLGIHGAGTPQQAEFAVEQLEAVLGLATNDELEQLSDLYKAANSGRTPPGDVAKLLFDITGGDDRKVTSNAGHALITYAAGLISKYADDVNNAGGNIGGGGSSGGGGSTGGGGTSSGGGGSSSGGGGSSSGGNWPPSGGGSSGGNTTTPAGLPSLIFGFPIATVATVVVVVVLIALLMRAGGGGKR